MAIATKEVTLHTSVLTSDTFKNLEKLFGAVGYHSESGWSDCANTCAGCSGCGGSCSGSCDGSCDKNFGW